MTIRLGASKPTITSWVTTGMATSMTATLDPKSQKGIPRKNGIEKIRKLWHSQIVLWLPTFKLQFKAATTLKVLWNRLEA
jgi:hypothetical protein